MGEGLVKGEGFAIDASLVKSRRQSSRAVRGTESIDWGPAKQQSRPACVNTFSFLEALDKGSNDKYA